MQQPSKAIDAGASNPVSPATPQHPPQAHAAPRPKSVLSVAHPAFLFLASSIGSTTGNLVVLPFDTLKVRMQLAGANSGTPRFVSAMECARHVVGHEGPRALFKGFGACVMRSVSYGGMRVGLYEPMKELVGGNSAEFTTAHKVVAGMAAGLVASALCSPTDLIKVRMQADRAGLRYRNVFHAFAHTVQTEGVRGMYRASHITTIRAGMLAGAEFATYDNTKTSLLPILGDSVLTHTLSGTLAAVVGTVCAHPADVVKTKLMNQPRAPNGKGLVYTGIWDCVVKVLRADGLRGAWKGLGPAMLRMAPMDVITWVVTEQVRIALNHTVASDR